MSFRPALALLFAAAMLIASLAMPARDAMAAPAPSHHGEMAQGGHCDGQPDEGDTDKSKAKPCCVAMCTAVAIAPSAPDEPHDYARRVERPATDRFGQSYLAKLPTPPPRRA